MDENVKASDIELLEEEDFERTLRSWEHGINKNVFGNSVGNELFTDGDSSDELKDECARILDEEPEDEEFYKDLDKGLEALIVEDAKDLGIKPKNLKYTKWND